ncbi:RelA/SpoT family protein [bacterium]|nr:RelA/SpoT family protein [bacterium]
MLQNNVYRAFQGIANLEENYIHDLLEFLKNNFSDKKRYTGESCLNYISNMARRLSGYNVDKASLVAAFTWNILELNPEGVVLLEKKFGPEVVELVTRMAKLSNINVSSTQSRETEKFRRLILALSGDIRVVFLRLMDRAHVLSVINEFQTQNPLANAQTARDIYAPLASRLGINRLKNELEDSSLKMLEPEKYLEIQLGVKERSSHHEMNVERIKMQIQSRLDEQGISATIKGRIKNINSIFKKMIIQKIRFEQVYDVIGIRIISRSNLIQDCYAVLGIIHSLWKPIPHRFKDFIAVPKENGYQSIHTSVIGPTGAPLEIQIRSSSMDVIAEVGLAAHWRYKEPGKNRLIDSEKFTWMRKVMEYLTEEPNASDIVEIFKVDMFPTEVYVFTPQGDVKSLPAGSTVVDFAFSVHSNVGHHCRHGKINNRLVPLKTVLANGDIVEIITSRKSYPHANWLTFVRTSRAKNKIRSYLRVQARDSMIKIGLETLKRELRRNRISLKGLFETEDFLEVIDRSGYLLKDDLFAAIGFNECSSQHVINRLMMIRATRFKEDEQEAPAKESDRTPGHIKAVGGINIATRFARCCEPLPGEKIVGYVTQGRGISIHSARCRSMLKLDRNRIVNVVWEEGDEPNYPVRIIFEGYQDPSLMQDITRVVVEHRVIILSQKIETSARNQLKVRGVLMLETKFLEEVDKIMVALRQIPAIKKVSQTRSRKNRKR